MAVVRVAGAFIVGTAMGAAANVIVLRDAVGFEPVIGWALAVAFGLIVALAVAFRLDERL